MQSTLTVFFVVFSLLFLTLTAWDLPRVHGLMTASEAPSSSSPRTHTHTHTHTGMMTMTGRHRRILRAIANREKQTGTLSTVQMSFKARKTTTAAAAASTEIPTLSVTASGALVAKTASDLRDFVESVNSINTPNAVPSAPAVSMRTLYAPSVEEIPSAVCEALCELMSERELVQVRFKDGVQKKQQAKAVGMRIAQRIAHCELVQVVGHSILLYRRSSAGNERISKMLESEFRRSVEREDLTDEDDLL